MDHDACSVISCGGKSAIERLYVIFNELGIPTYVIFDFDKGKEPKDVKDAKAIFERLDRPVPDPLNQDVIDEYLTCLYSDWETSWRADIVDHAARAAVANKALGYEGGKISKPLVARFHARQSVAKAPPEIPVTVAKILTMARAIKYRGTCLKK